MPTAEELVVALKSEGAQEVNSDLKNTESRMEGTADAAEKQADRLGSFANKVKGAMAAIVAGLAIGAAGILSQVPVIGEAMAGLKSVFTAVAFQIDKRLRPGLTKLNKELFELSNAIMAGDYEQAKKEIKDISAVISDFKPDINTKNVAKQVGKAVGTIIDKFTAAMKKTSAEDYRTAADNFITPFQIALKASAKETDFSDFAVTLIVEIGQGFIGISKAIRRNITGPIFLLIAREFFQLMDAAEEWGSGIIDGVIQGIKNKLGELQELLNSIGIGNIGGISLSDETETTTKTVNSNGLFSSNGFSDSGLQLDGRQLSESTGRYRADPSRRRNI